MTSTCADCGKEHPGLPRYFQWGAPVIEDSEILDFDFDNTFMCKVASKRFFISCELEIPFTDSNDDPLGFIGWVEVSGSAYQRYAEYRDLEDSCPPYETLVDGRLANPIPSIPDSLGISVRFEVLAGDPTPYIKWVEPNTPVAARLTLGATPSFWHAAAGLLAAEP